MTDLTPALNALLTTKYSAKPTTSTATSPDDFLKEAYRIVGVLTMNTLHKEKTRKKEKS